MSDLPLERKGYDIKNSSSYINDDQLNRRFTPKDINNDLEK